MSVHEIAAALLGAVLLGTAGIATAQNAECIPTCREGFLCHEGRCISACNPPCATGERCTSGGECVQETCTPACGEGFLCHRGSCISACNPPCAAGERCTSAGECTIASSSPAPPPNASVAAPSPVAAPSGPTAAPPEGWTSTAPTDISTPATGSAGWVSTAPVAAGPPAAMQGGWVSAASGPTPPRTESRSTPVIQGNVGGVMMFGPAFSFELPVTPSFTIAPRVRVLNFGVLAHETLADIYEDFGDHEIYELNFGVGTGAGARVYFGSNNTGFYLGAVVELAYSSWREAYTESDWDSWCDCYEYNTRYRDAEFAIFTLFADIGFRFDLGRTFVLGIGAEGGLQVLSDDGHGIPLAQGVLELGWRL